MAGFAGTGGMAIAEVELATRRIEGIGLAAGPQPAEQ
jgi:hypothetical protein